MALRQVGTPRLTPFDLLEGQPAVNDSLGGEDILVFLEKDTDTALVYQRAVNGQTLTFRLEGQGTGHKATLVDDQTGTRWSALTGAAIEGPLSNYLKMARRHCRRNHRSAHASCNTPR